MTYLFFSFLSAIAQPAAPVTQADLSKTLAALATVRNASRNERVLAASAAFLGKPYFGGGTTGEGTNSDYDQDPIITFAGFDCTTYIEAAIAVAETAPLCSETTDAAFFAFSKNTIAIKYRDGATVSYVNRNHFTEVDWLPSLQRLGILEDATPLFQGFPEIEKEAFIDRYGWGLAKKSTDLRIYRPKAPSSGEMDARTGSLHYEFEREGKTAIPAVLKVFELETLASADFQKRLIEVLQTEKILQFQLVKKSSPAFGLLVTHQGFIVLGENGKPVVRHASPGAKAVVDMDFHDYIEARKTDKLPTLGFNIQRFLN